MLIKKKTTFQESTVRYDGLGQREVLRLIYPSDQLFGVFIAFLLMSVFAGFQFKLSTWIFTFITVLEGILAGMYLAFVGLHFCYCHRYLKEYPLRWLVGIAMVRIAFLTLAFLNGYFFTIYVPTANGFQLEMKSWTGGLVLLALFITLEWCFSKSLDMSRLRGALREFNKKNKKRTGR